MNNEQNLTKTIKVESTDSGPLYRYKAYDLNSTEVIGYGYTMEGAIQNLFKEEKTQENIIILKNELKTLINKVDINILIDKPEIIYAILDTIKKEYKEENNEKEIPNKHSKQINEISERIKVNDYIDWFFAAVENDIDTIINYISAGIDINVTDNSHRTALMYAIYANSKDVVYKLLEYKDEINIYLRDNKGDTIFDCANVKYYIDNIDRVNDYKNNKNEINKSHIPNGI